MANPFIIFGVSVTLGAMAGFGINLARAVTITPSGSAVEPTHLVNGPRLASLTRQNAGSNTSAEAGINAVPQDEPQAADESDADSDAYATSTDEEASEPESAQTGSSDEPPPADDSSERDATEPEPAATTTESGALEPGSAEPAAADSDAS